MSIFQTARLQEKLDYSAPDKSEIRLLPTMNGGGLCHCSLPAYKVSQAVKHKTVEEIWYFLEGLGEVWRKQDDQAEIVEVKPGVCLTIPIGTHFQFRNTSSAPLHFLIITMPPWPGEEEAVKIENYWKR
jgi:mannose-6-phosphate isomerase-like protein (cupin superfamily)